MNQSQDLSIYCTPANKIKSPNNQTLLTSNMTGNKFKESYSKKVHSFNHYSFENLNDKIRDSANSQKNSNLKKPQNNKILFPLEEYSSKNSKLNLRKNDNDDANAKIVNEFNFSQFEYNSTKKEVAELNIKNKEETLCESKMNFRKDKCNAKIDFCQFIPDAQNTEDLLLECGYQVCSENQNLTQIIK